MKKALSFFVVMGLAAAAFGDDGRWYDSAQRINWGFTVSNGEATISTPGFWDSNARDNCTGDIVVPSRIGPDGPSGKTTYPVRDMAPGLFRHCTKVTSVRLPDGIRRIAGQAFFCKSDPTGHSTITNITIGTGCLDICDEAFQGCQQLVSVNIPNTVTNIGHDAFSMCYALPRIAIPGSVKTIGDSAFSACYALEAVTFGDGIEIIDADAFMNCSSLLAADLPASVRSIGDRAFSGCNQLASATLREGLEKIGFCAFIQCESLVSVSIPESVTWVGERAFQQCPDSIFDKATVPGVCLLSGWAVGVDNPFGAIDLFGVNGVADGLFKDCRDVTSVVLPPGIETLGDSMFSGCRSLEAVSLPAALKSIESYAFQSCQKVQAVNIPSGVTNIGQLAFGYCEKLAAVALPDGLAAMGDNAFDGCTNLTSLTIPASLKRIPMAAFENCTSLTNVTVEEGVEVIGNASFYGCRALPAFTIPDSVKVVEDIAFYGCAFLDTNTIANVEMADGWIVGSSQPNLTEVTVPGDVRGISECAFSYRNNLTNAVVEEGVTVIPFQAFAFDAKLTDVALPASLSEIGKQVFCGCRSLVSIYVPSNVVAIGEEAFASCSALETVYLPVALTGKVNEANLVNGSFHAKVRYYNPDGSLVPLPDPDPDPDPEVETWTVVFNPNGGEFEDAEDAEREVEKGTAVGELPVPVRTGYSFGGWWTAKTKGTKITASTKITKNATYYARWTIRKYKVSAAVNSKTMGAVSGAGTKAYNTKVTLKAAPKKGHVFVRWELTGSEDTPWPSVAKSRQPSVSFTLGAADVSVRAVFAKASADAAPVLTVASSDDWYVEAEPGREIRVEADSLSYPAVTVKGAPAGIGLVRVADMDDATYVLKVTDASKMKPGVYAAKITAKNRAGRSASRSVRIVAPNSTAAIGAGLISGLKTSTLDPYRPAGGMKTKWTPADLGAEVFATNGWKLASVTGLPAGLKWNGTAIVGTATKTGVFTVTFTMKKTVKTGKKTKTYTSTASATFVVDALLPADLAGTYNGFANTNYADEAEGEDEGEGEYEDEGEGEEFGVYAPIVDSWASAAKVTVSAAGKITANIGSVAITGNGFDSVSNGVYAVTLKKTQKIAKGSLKGKSKVWEAYVEIDTTVAWDGMQLVGWYRTYTTGIPSMSAPSWITCQRNAFGGSAEAKAVAAAVAGVWRFTPKSVKGEGWVYDLLGGGKALSVTVKSNGAATLAGKIGSLKASGSATLVATPIEMVEVEPTVHQATLVPRQATLRCSGECDDPVLVARRTATARFFVGKFIVEMFYTLQEGAVVSVSGRVWKIGR